MDSYIVRIYRRGPGDSEDLFGLVESVGSKQRTSFGNFPELTAVLRSVLEQDHDDVATRLQQTGLKEQPVRINLDLIAGLKG